MRRNSSNIFDFVIQCQKPIKTQCFQYFATIMTSSWCQGNSGHNNVLRAFINTMINIKTRCKTVIKGICQIIDFSFEYRWSSRGKFLKCFYEFKDWKFLGGGNYFKIRNIWQNLVSKFMCIYNTKELIIIFNIKWKNLISS